MNTSKLFFPFILLIFLPVLQTSAQGINDDPIGKNEYFINEYPYWVDMMNDPTINFYDVQEAFNEYFSDKPKGKGTGWKQFKRWEWFMEQRVYPSGERIPQAQAWNEMKKFKKLYPSDGNLPRGNWEDMGPHDYLNNTGHWNPGLGRINVIERDPDNQDIIYFGAPSGGLWRTTDEGGHWEILTDHLPVIGVSGIALHPDDPDIIYIGTGDKDANDNYSIGVLKSTDGGYTWMETGLNWQVTQGRTIAKLMMHPDDPKTLFAATTSGLFRTQDDGDTWTKLLNGDIDDLEFKPGDPDIIYALTKKLYRSTDGGENFSLVSSATSSGRAQIAVTEANPDYVYFFSSTGGIYRSEDSGETFTFRSNNPSPGYQSWYDLACAASHVDADEFHIGEINTFRSLDGGFTWTQTTDWTWNNGIGYTHCDIHELVFYGGTLYVGSDGLICKSENSGNSWTDLSLGINIRQFYRIGASQNSLYKILGGSQDNGTSVYTEFFWHEWLGADGMECAVNYENENIVYGTSQNGIFYKSNQGGNFGNVNITQPGGGNWITPFVMHPTNPDILYVGNDRIRKTTNGMNSWTTLLSGGGNFNTMAISRSNPDYLYATRGSSIYRTDDGGQSWTDISFGLPNYYITYVTVHPSNSEIISISFSGYEEGEKVYISYDAGNNWENYSANLPNLPANCVVFADDPLNGLYTGMDVGVYYRDDGLTEWESFMEGLPNVIVNELEIHYEAGKIRAATYGRGLWESDIRMNEPIADFSASHTLIPVGCSIDFTSLSSGPPQEYQWTFEGGEPETSTDKDPSGITYNNEGTYSVSLTVSNIMGTNTLTREDYITVSSTLLPEPDFSASETFACTDAVISFTDETDYCPAAWTWVFDPGSVLFLEGTNENSQNPVVQFLERGSYNVTLHAENNNGSSSITKENYIVIGGALLPFTEDFEEGFDDSKGWTIENPDNGKTWEIAEVGGCPSGSKAAMVNIFQYLVPQGPRDRLISPPINLEEALPGTKLSLKHAYAKKYPSITDSLIIYISDNCGGSWSRIFSGGDDGSGNFATHELTTEEFFPETEEDWCGAGYGSNCIDVDLTEWIGMPDVKFMFETYHFLGNNIFIDDIMITGPVSVDDETGIEEGIQIFPNPTSGIINIRIYNLMEDTRIEVVNLHGQIIAIKDAGKEQVHTFNLSNYPEGIYFIIVNSESKQLVEKVVLQ